MRESMVTSVQVWRSLVRGVAPTNMVEQNVAGRQEDGLSNTGVIMEDCYREDGPGDTRDGEQWDKDGLWRTQCTKPTWY